MAGTQNLLYFHLSLLKSDKELFRDFNDFTLKCGKPIETVLSSSRDVCRKCGRKLVFENKAIPVVIYSDHRGTYLRSRLAKMCRKCKIYEHHRYWSVDGKRHFHRDSVLSEFLLSSEDTAFQMDVLAECNNLLVISLFLSVRMQLVTIDVSSIVKWQRQMTLILSRANCI